MASTKQRQRKLARERAERRLKALAQRQRRRRQRLAATGAVIGLVAVILGTTWLLGGFDSAPEDTGPAVARGSCSWTLKDATTDPNIVDTGHPDTEGAPRSGTQTMTLKTNLGDIEATIDLSKAPCTAASFSYLSKQKYYDNSTCHRVSALLKVLQCGDPKGNGAGSPSYTFADEDKPDTTPVDASGSPDPTATARPGPYYAKGDIIMVNTGMNTNGGQFYIVTDNDSSLSAAYSIVGKVTKGMDIVDSVAKAGAVDENGKAVEEGKPKKTITIQQLVMGTPVTASASPSATSSATSSPSSSPSGS